MNTDNEYQFLFQPLYSRETIKAYSDYDTVFFSRIRGEGVSYTSTGMDYPHCMAKEYSVDGIRFRVIMPQKSIYHKYVKHLMRYGHFVFRLVDRDFLICPFALMEYDGDFLVKKIGIPIMIHKLETFQVSVRLDKPPKKNFDVICELLGYMKRLN